MNTRDMASYEGLQDSVRMMETPAVETWKNQFPDRDYVIQIDIPEFTCICPKTGLPDFASIVVRYVPDEVCLELKSLKYYTLFFRNVGIFNENVVNRMLDDFVRSCKPRWMEVSGEFNARGGIKTTVVVEHGERPREPAAREV
ncbi:MAG: preQ(1) synthase [Candidatus Dadabacteria bacterium]|nr:preQ(1) synthase [Candidatus Dadabacteria bacterium]